MTKTPEFEIWHRSENLSDDHDSPDLNSKLMDSYSESNLKKNSDNNELTNVKLMHGKKANKAREFLLSVCMAEAADPHF